MSLVIGKGPSSINLPDFSGTSGEGIVGFGTYNDDNTETNAITVLSQEWTDITCDGAGSGTNVAHLPTDVTRLWDVTDNVLKIDELNNENYVIVRLQFKITPAVNDASVSMRVEWTTQSGFTFRLAKRMGRLNDGAGVEYELSDQIIVYVGDDDSRLGEGKIQLNCDSDSTVEIDTVFIGVN